MCPEIKKIYFSIIVLETETSLAKKDVRPSLETLNVIDVIVYVSYIYSQIKNIKNIKCKKKQLKIYKKRKK